MYVCMCDGMLSIQSINLLVFALYVDPLVQEGRHLLNSSKLRRCQ